MNLQHLRYFLMVMETGAVARAASRLGITQPTLSAALKGLEQEFAVKLFAPDGRGIRPLPAAKQLEAKVRLALGSLAEAKRDLAGSEAAPLRIGMLPSLPEGWLQTLAHSHDRPLTLIEAAPDELARQLGNGALDLAVTARSDGDRLPHKQVLRERFVLFVSSAHEFAGRRSVALAELDRKPLVLRQGCERLGSAGRLLEAAGVRFAVVAKTRQEATAAALVAAGIGVTLAPRSWQRPGVRVVEVAGLSLVRELAVVWRDAANASQAAAIAVRLKGLAAATAA